MVPAAHLRLAGDRRRRHHPWRVAAIGSASAFGLLLLAIGTIVPLHSDSARVALIKTLGRQLDAEVELADLHFRVLPRLRAEGSGLTIRHHGRRDVPPLISIAHFSAESGLIDLLRRHVARVVLTRLDIQIPPDRNRDDPDDPRHRADDDEGPSAAPSTAATTAKTLVIDELIATDGQLAIIPKEEGKKPRVWGIHALRMLSVAADRAMPFDATLTNAVPPGDIETSGSFGPWQAGNPRETPLEGSFTFDRADLGVFKGISGILSAHGSFGGSLDRIAINGETDTPDFTVRAGGHPMALHTRYRATTDGTNGNTMLDEIQASFLNTSIVAKGGVIGKPGVDGRTVTLSVTIDQGRIEDVLRLAVNTALPPMSGALRLTTNLLLPPGDMDVVKKLQLDGAFSIADTRFSNAEVQAKIDGLSQRTRGLKTAATARVSSHFNGTFALANGRLDIPRVSFNVPGSIVQLTGTYGLLSEAIDFSGTAYTDAKVSQMTTGYKRWLLKPADWLFRREGGGAAIPIRISGTRNQPSFGLDKGRIFKRH